MRYLLSFLFFAQISLAQNAAFDTMEDSDPKALEILEKIEAEFTSTPSHLINFTFVIESPGNPNDTYKGTLLQAGEKFELDLGSRVMLSDNESVWLYTKEDNEVQISDADFGDGGEYMSPSTIFSLYRSKEFIFAISNHATENGKAITQIEGKPASNDSEYSKVRLTLEDKDLKVKRLKIFAKDGSRMTMEIQSHKTNVPFQESDFIFNEATYEGVIIEDLRF